MTTSNGQLVFSEWTDQLNMLVPGSIVVLTPCPAAPNGLLGNVTSVQLQDGRGVVDIAPATLTDVFDFVSVSIRSGLVQANLVEFRPLLEGVRIKSAPHADAARSDVPEKLIQLELDITDVVLFDADGDESTLGDQVRAAGSIAVELTYYFDLYIANASLKTLTFVTHTSQMAQLSITSGVVGVVDETIELGEISFSPFPVPGGLGLIWATPELVLETGITGLVSAQLEVSASQYALFTAGLSF